MGEVYSAVIAGGFAGIEKRCVIKTLHTDLSEEADYVTRFLDEARLAVQLNQSNICSVFDVGVVDGQHYLAMDLIHGRDLRSVWRRSRELGRMLGPGLVVHIMAQVLDALEYAHALTDSGGHPLHIVHRDVSPQNVMISFDGDVKIIDFGLAASRLKIGKTADNIVMGKLAYMAPEQLMGESVDARADLFAAGIVIYEMVAGERYYEGTQAVLLPTVVTTGTHVPRKWPSLPPGLRAVLERALFFDREKRFPQAAAFADALREWAAIEGHLGNAAALRREMKDLFGSNMAAVGQESGSGARALPAPLKPGAVLVSVPLDGNPDATLSGSQTQEVAPALEATRPTEDPTGGTSATGPIHPGVEHSGVSETMVVPRQPLPAPQKRPTWPLALGFMILVILAVIAGFTLARG